MNTSQLFFSVACAALMLTSCTKFEDGPAISFKPVKSRLLGEWEVTSFSGVGSEDPNGWMEAGNFVLELERDNQGRFTQEYNDGHIEGLLFEWALDGTQLALDFPNENNPNWTFDIERLTMREMRMDADSASSLTLPGVIWNLEKR